jgi:hypothetical protein
MSANIGSAPAPLSASQQHRQQQLQQQQSSASAPSVSPSVVQPQQGPSTHTTEPSTIGQRPPVDVHNNNTNDNKEETKESEPLSLSSLSMTKSPSRVRQQKNDDHTHTIRGEGRYDEIYTPDERRRQAISLRNGHSAHATGCRHPCPPHSDNDTFIEMNHDVTAAAPQQQQQRPSSAPSNSIQQGDSKRSKSGAGAGCGCDCNKKNKSNINDTKHHGSLLSSTHAQKSGGCGCDCNKPRRPSSNCRVISTRQQMRNARERVALLGHSVDMFKGDMYPGEMEW